MAGDRVAIYQFTADELRNIAHALGLNDAGAQEMLEQADHMDALDAEEAATPRLGLTVVVTP